MPQPSVQATSPARRLLLLGVVLVLTWLLWNTPVVYPIRILVTFLHETSHGLAALATGGKIDHIVVEPDGSGVCWTLGGWKSVIFPAGYLGSMLWGSLILILACRTRLDRLISILLGAGLVAICLLYVRSPFGFCFGLLIGFALIAAGVWLREKGNDFILMCIGTVTCLHAIFDLKTLWKISGSVNNDALMCSQEVLPLPPSVWVILWSALAIACFVWALSVALPRRRNSA